MQSHLQQNNEYIGLLFKDQQVQNRICKLASEIYIENVSFDDNDSSVIAYLPSGQTVQNISARATTLTLESLQNPQRYLTPIFRPSQSSPRDIESAVIAAIDSEERHLLDFCLSAYSNDALSVAVQPKTTLLALGMLSLVGFENLEQEKVSTIQNIVVLEHSLEAVAAFFTLVDFKALLRFLDNHGIGFSLIFSDSEQGLVAEFESFLVLKEPTSVYSFTLCQPVLPSPTFAAVKGWIESPQGLCGVVDYLFGNETDEINQYAHARANISNIYCSVESALISTQNPQLDNSLIVLCASGPSLDDELEFLARISESAPIVAAGSSIGALIRNGVGVSCVVILEMSSTVYWDLLQLVDEGYHLADIELIASITIDPRIANLFRRVTFFGRPSSSTSALLQQSSPDSLLLSAGPQVANAALEALLMLGYRSFYLAGCDFSSSDPEYNRARDAAGKSIRVLDLPVKSRAGKTIYTNTDLIITVDFFSNALKTYSATAVAKGDGLRIDNTRTISEIDSSEFSSKNELFSRLNLCHQSGSLGSRADEIGSGVSNGLYISFQHADLISVPLDFVNSIIRDINSNSHWSRRLQRSLNTYLSFEQQSMASNILNLAVTRIMRSLLLLAIRPLASTDAESYRVVSQECCSALLRAGEVTSALLMAVEKQCSPSVAGRIWSPEILRRRVVAPYC